MKHVLVILAAAILASCASPTSTPPSATATTSGAGSSYATAIVVPASNEMTGVKWEYAYIRAHYAGYRFIMQGLSTHGSKPYDMITFATRDGKQHTLFFDISRYFGRY